MSLLWSYGALLALVVVLAVALNLLRRLLTADHIESQKSAERVKSLADAILGRTRTRDDWLPDARVKGGMVYNKDAKRLEVSGRLSDDSFSRIFRRRTQG